MRFLRAVILDNDETTGWYPLVFGMLSVLQNHPELTNDDVATVLERLADWMLEHKFFRPGLVEFLKTLIDLRQEDSLDAIIMYTNQVNCTPPMMENTMLELWSPAHAITYMMCWLVKDFVFDHILTRPLDVKCVPGTNYFPKQFKRIFDLYPDKLVNTKYVLFFDDLAIPTILRTDGIAKIATYDYSRVIVSPYRCSYTEKDISNCAQYCLKGYSFIKSAVPELLRVMNRYTVSIPEDEVQISCAYMRDVVKIHFEKDYNPKHK